MEQQSHYKNEVDLIDYIKIVYKRRRMLMIIVLFSMLFTGIYSFSQPKLYEAYATFFPMNSSYGIQQGGFIVQPKLDIEDLIISILESRKMKDRIIEKLDLKNASNEKSAPDAKEAIGMATKITVNRKGIIKLSVQTESPALSAKIANAYVDNLDYFNRQLDIGAQRQVVQVIDRAIVPEKRMPRGTVGKTVQAGFISFVFAICLSLFLEFIKKANIVERLREK